MSKKIFFEKIGERIMAEANAVILVEENKIKSVQLWNNQLDNDTIEEPTGYPMAFIEFVDVPWRSQGLGIQKADMEFSIHVVTEKYNTDDRDFLDIVDAVFIALNGYSINTCFSSIERLSDTQDVDHDNCIDWITNFVTVLIDATGDRTRPRVPVDPVTLEITTELDIDNPVVRTGDGEF